MNRNEKTVVAEINAIIEALKDDAVKRKLDYAVMAKILVKIRENAEYYQRLQKNGLDLYV